MIVDREAPSVEAAGGAAERNGTKLLLHLTSGKIQTLTDGPSCFDDLPKTSSCYGYEFIRYERAHGVFVVHQYHYEGGEHIIIDDRSGKLTQLESDPYFSPNGDTALELVYGEDGYYSGQPRTSIWRRHGGRFILEWSKPLTDGYGEASFSILGWRSNEHVDLEAVPSLSWSDAGARRFSIKRAANGWQVIER